LIQLELAGYVIEVNYTPSSIKDLICHVKPHVKTSQEKMIHSLTLENAKLIDEISFLKNQLSVIQFSSNTLIEDLKSLCTKKC